ncbi:MAG: ATP-binding protein [Aigarchaeota archaeon]|nr:ATP-binding protein [Aigarchaeota archaeon]MDW8092510.1 ATP-binding protein [Nitrososphaerota archaeon]
MSELEKIAIAKAREAVSLDRSGSVDEAVSRYREVIDILWKLYSLSDSVVVKSIYRDKIKQYQERLKELTSGGEPVRRFNVENRNSKSPLVIEHRGDINWDDIIGLSEAKRALRESIVYPKMRPDLFPLGWPTGILLFGPPGCGKTLLISAAATEIGATLYTLDASVIMSRWLGESEKNVAEVFSNAREEASEGTPVIIFIDEIDSLATYRSLEVGGEARVRNQLLHEMDGLHTKGNKYYLYVVGATNKPWLLDEPFIRRFQRRIYIRPPDRDQRLLLFNHYTKDLKVSSDVSFEYLADITEGYSAADIHSICIDAHMNTVREMFETGSSEPREVSLKDFESAISRRKPSIIKENQRRYEEWYERYGAV